MRPPAAKPKIRPSGATKFRGYHQSNADVLTLVSTLKPPPTLRTSGRSAPPRPPCTYTLPFGSNVVDAYQRGRFTCGPRVSVSSESRYRFVWLLPFAPPSVV